jgi:hypothetical protein
MNRRTRRIVWRFLHVPCLKLWRDAKVRGQCGRVRCQYRQLELADFDEPLDDQQDNNCDETIDEKYSNKGC